MVRKKRFIQAGCCYHVMLRGNGGRNIFNDREDYVRFCLLLQYASEMHQLTIHAFCVMSNHLHLVIQPQTADLASGMHVLAFRYAQYYNNKHDRVGSLYQGRYKTILVQSGAYFQSLIRYVHLNPVRANITKRPEEYLWSSYLPYLGLNEYTWLNRTLVLSAFGGEHDPKSIENIVHHTNIDDNKAREEAMIIRNSVKLGVYGDSEFSKKWWAILFGDKPSKSPLTLTLKDNALETIVASVCARTKTTLQDIRSSKRQDDLILARLLIARLVKQTGTVTFTELGKYLG
ncbi:MAG: transposase, partial [Verrucomicrobia bacterium]|nr:transposase [Verrucomicrobiota bacterium]